MKKIVLFVTLGIIGTSTLGNPISVFADEISNEQVTLLDIEEENLNYESEQHIIQKRENDSRMPYELKKPNNLSKGAAKCGAAIVSGLFGISKGPIGWASGIAGAYAKCN